MAKQTNETKAAKGKEPSFLEQFRKCYPENKTFYVTADNMVFLSHQENDARNHQRTIGEGEVKTY